MELLTFLDRETSVMGEGSPNGFDFIRDLQTPSDQSTARRFSPNAPGISGPQLSLSCSVVRRFVRRARSPPSSSLLTHATRAPPAFVTQRCVFPAARCRARRRRDSRRRRDARAAARPRAAVAPRDFVLLAIDRTIERSIAAPSSDERPSRDRASRGPSRSLATPRATRGVDARASAGSRGRRETFPGVRDDAGFLQRFSRRRRFA